VNLRTSLVAVVLLLLAGGLLFHFFQSRLTGPLLTFSAHPEVLDLLEASLDDQRQLASGDPENEGRYRRRFAATATLVQRLQILEHNRGDLARRYEQILLAVFAATALVVMSGVVLRQSRHTRRLDRLQAALVSLADGRTDIEIGERRRDTIGRIAAMIERTSRVMARDRRRLKSLRNLSSWQESARRHAHEMRTPLTGALLELDRLDSLLAGEPLSRRDAVREVTHSVSQELERLRRFTRQFTSFARVPRPKLEEQDLSRLIEDLVSTFDSAWPNLELAFSPPGEAERESTTVALDRDMVRRVLVNLCDNSSHALAERSGTVTLTLEASQEVVFLDVADDGPGIDDGVHPRLFEPYTTTRTIGEGMGLGLAISKKILLDLGGDLELQESSPAGAVFRLTFNRRMPEDAS